MAEFERAFTIHDRDEFIAARAEKIVSVAKGAKGKWGEGRGDVYFIARQRAYFLNAYDECRCHPLHSCAACAILIGVVGKLEHHVEQLDQGRCEIEEAKVRAICSRLWSEHRRQLAEVQQTHERLKAEKKQVNPRFVHDPEAA